MRSSRASYAAYTFGAKMAPWLEYGAAQIIPGRRVHLFVTDNVCDRHPEHMVFRAQKVRPEADGIYGNPDRTYPAYGAHYREEVMQPVGFIDERASTKAQECEQQ